MPAGTDLRYINAKDVKVWRPEGSAHLRVEIVNDRTILSARIRRLFPLSEPETHLSIQDGEGKEVAILPSLDGMPPAMSALVMEELDRRYFTPAIERIDDLTSERGMWRFNVQTQRGVAEFWVRNWRDSSHEMAPGRWQIHSVDGQRYEILQLESLDARTQRLLEQLL